MQNTVGEETKKQGTLVINRSANGTYAKGTVAYRGGSRPWMTRDESNLLRESGIKAVCKIVSMLEATRPIVIGRDADARVEMVPDSELQFRAALAILERLYGKNPQAIEVVTSQSKPAVDLSQLTDQELDALQVLKSAQRRIMNEQASAQEVVDTESGEDSEP